MRACAAIAVTLLACGAARAQRGVETETFRPAVDSYGIFTVERAETGRQWDYGFKAWADYAHQPLRFWMKDAMGAPQRRVLMDFQVTTRVQAHLSLFNWALLAIELPVAAQQYTSHYGSIDDPIARTGFFAAGEPTNVPPPNAAPLDARVALKLRTPRLGPVGFALLAAATLPFGDETAFLGDSGFTFRPTGIIDLTLWKFTAAINVGYVLRKKTVVLDPADVAARSPQPSTLIELGDEISFSAGAALRIIPMLGVGAELYGLMPLGVAPAPADRVAVPPDRVLDVLGGLQIFPGRDVTISVGGGAGLLAAASRRDLFRVFLGLSWAPVEGRATGAGTLGGGGLDGDGDGIPDGGDLCPKEKEDKDGFDDEDGCPDGDNDQDGILDGADRCPNEAEDRDGYLDGDGCPEPDNDGDGVDDLADRCPNEPEDKDGFQDDDGCPDGDNDGDGIPDGADRCPNEPETKNGVDDEDGCPDTGGAISIAAGKVELPEQVQFETGRAAILPRSFALLERVAAKLKQNPQVRKVRIEGHTDDQGGEKKNQEISQARADSVLDFLVKRGVEPERLQAAGYGSSRPIASNRTASGRAQNRRVEFIIVEQ